MSDKFLECPTSHDHNRTMTDRLQRKNKTQTGNHNDTLERESTEALYNALAHTSKSNMLIKLLKRFT